MGKASDFDRRMEGRFLQPGQLWPKRPDVRVRDDTPSLEADETTVLDAILDRLTEKTGVVVRDERGAPKAVVLSPERYAELASCVVESEDRFRATLNHSNEPDPQALQELMIEQIDPAAEWKAGSRLSQEVDQP